MKFHNFLLICFWAMMTCYPESSAYVYKQNLAAEKRILDTILSIGNYDSRIRPNGLNGTRATKVSVNLFVRSIQEIDDIDMKYSTQLTFRMQWMDQRLAYTNHSGAEGVPYLTTKDPRRIWVPDLFFSNEIEGHFHDLLVPNVYVRIFPDGQVLYSMRISLTLSCPMGLMRFPFDYQTCSLRMASYGYTNDDLIFQWKQYDPVQITKDLYLLKYSLREFTSDYCDSHTNTGSYSCLRLDFLFKRYFHHYFTTVFAPLGLLMGLSYLSLWIGEIGFTISFMTFILVIVSSVAIGNNKPIVSYMTAMDVWTVWCSTSSFIAFLICFVAKFLGNGNGQHGRHTGEGDVEEINLRSLFAWKELNLVENYRGMPLWKKVLVIWQVVFPIVFLIFFLCYYVAYVRNIYLHEESDEYFGLGDKLDTISENENQPGKMTLRQPRE